MDIIAKTQHLIIRPVMDEDAEDLLEILGDPQVMRYSVNGVQDAEGVARYIAMRKVEYDHPGFSLWGVELEGEGKLIGLCGIVPMELDGRTEIELGYRFNRAYQGQGYGFEASEAVVKYAFERLGFNHLVAVIEASNERSINLVQKLGMQYEKDSVYHGVPVQVYLLNRY